MAPLQVPAAAAGVVGGWELEEGLDWAEVQAMGCSVASESCITGEEVFTDFRVLLSVPYVDGGVGAEPPSSSERKCTLADLRNVL